ncbi:MAG: SGNH/GDSL hydrolase family protein [Verrucomicrobiota bacterium]
MANIVGSLGLYLETWLKNSVQNPTICDPHSQVSKFKKAVETAINSMAATQSSPSLVNFHLFLMNYSSIRHLAFAILCLSSFSFATEPPVAKESDPRVQSDGKGWRLDKATRTDPKLPRVLLIGDSILNGYGHSVVKGLEGKAYVDSWVNPYNQSENLNRILADVLSNGPYDVVHFNMGLHGWQEGRIKPGTFEPLTTAYVQVIKTQNPQAKIIWACSTPVTVKGKPTELDDTINTTIVEHNKMAAKVMREQNVPVNDFYSALISHLELARGDQFHWTKPAYETLAKLATESILRELQSSTEIAK